MSRQDKAKALSRLNDVLKKAQDIKELSTDSPDFKKWLRDATVAIRHSFGENSDHVADFKNIHFSPWVVSEYTDWDEAYQAGLRSAEAMLKSMIDEVEEYWEDAPAVASGIGAGGTEVFLIHGRDEAAKLDVARFLEQLDLEPVILAEQPSGGRTIIEKVEAHADVGYAIALLTPDDVGSRQGDDAVRPRARQNVVFELGYFIGRLGRKRVCVLTKGQPEIPSDYSGVVYVPMASDAWKMGLIKELKAAGFDVDANKVFGK